MFASALISAGFERRNVVVSNFTSRPRGVTSFMLSRCAIAVMIGVKDKSSNCLYKSVRFEYVRLPPGTPAPTQTGSRLHSRAIMRADSSRAATSCRSAAFHPIASVVIVEFTYAVVRDCLAVSHASSSASTAVAGRSAPLFFSTICGSGYSAICWVAASSAAAVLIAAAPVISHPPIPSPSNLITSVPGIISPFHQIVPIGTWYWISANGLGFCKLTSVKGIRSILAGKPSHVRLVTYQ